MGDVIEIAEADRCYGVGALTLRLTRIGADIERHPGLEWVNVEGVEQLAAGGEGGQRRMLVRAAALREHRLAS